MFRLSVVLVAFAIQFHAAAFLPKISSRVESQRRFLPSTSLQATSSSPLAGAGFDLTAGFISSLAVIALKLRLADHSDVTCDVYSTSSDLLLKGRVGPVTVKGKGWKSGLGLTCRAIEATVDTCELDINRILSDKKLVLTIPAKGKAMIALNDVDFGNFITHPLLRPPDLDGAGMLFHKRGARIDPVAGTVTFFAEALGERWKCTLRRGTSDEPPARIHVEPFSPRVEQWRPLAERLNKSLNRFFNEMIFELDGTFLSFRDMMVTDKGPSPSVMLSLNISVHKFPSPGLSF